MRGIFRAIVVLALLLQLVWFYLPYTWVYLYEGDALNLLQWSGYGASIDLYGPIPYVVLGAYTAVLVGLALFQTWARPAFVILIVASVLTTPLWGISVVSPVGGAVGYVVSLADGAIITLAYFTTLSRDFDKFAQRSAVADAAEPRG